MDRTHWVFPVVAPDARKLIDTLRHASFDATAATSSITAIAAPPNRPELRPGTAIDLVRDVVFLPVYPELPERAFKRLLDVLHATFAGAAKRNETPAEPVPLAPSPPA